LNWIRIILLGIVLWLVPFALSVALFGIHDTDRALFESLVTLTGITLAVFAAYLALRHEPRASMAQGALVGLAWAGISIAIDLPIFLFGFHFQIADYIKDVALTYIAFPIIGAGIGRALSTGQK
jgi:hypothetical protein